MAVGLPIGHGAVQLNGNVDLKVCDFVGSGGLALGGGVVVFRALCRWAWGIGSMVSCFHTIILCN